MGSPDWHTLWVRLDVAGDENHAAESLESALDGGSIAHIIELASLAISGDGFDIEEARVIRADPRVFTLDGEVVNLGELLADNMFEPIDVHEIDELPVGGEIVYGGGAFATFVLRRIS
jgi:hypothetical protein